MTSEHGHVLHDHDSAPDMIAVETARERVLARVAPLAPIELPLAEAFGCVLAEGVSAPAALPLFASSAMDGFAVRASDVATATANSAVGLRVVGRVRIGLAPDVTVGNGEAARIATGAPIPAGADAIVPIENCIAGEDTVSVLQASPLGKHVRPAGEDVRAGESLAPAGRRISGAEMGLFASAGLARVPVYPRPRVVILATGDELVEPGKTLEYGQIHDSNSFTLSGALKEVGAQPVIANRVPDDVDALREEVSSQFGAADAFISSGGVSVGERDVVKGAFAGKGEIDFYRVAMQPGMPQGFGLIDGKPFFGLPGNPVSVFVSFEVFVRPALMKMLGRKQLYRPQVRARLTADLSGPSAKTMYARVMLERGRSGNFLATPTGGRGSNLFSTVTRANGLAEVPAGVESISAGEDATVHVFRSLED